MTRPRERHNVVVAKATEAEGHKLGQRGCGDNARIGVTSSGEERDAMCLGMNFFITWVLCID